MSLIYFEAFICFTFYLTFIYTGNLIETQGLIFKRDLFHRQQLVTDNMIHNYIKCQVDADKKL